MMPGADHTPVRPSRPRVLVIADVPDWIFARHARTLERFLGDRFAFTVQYRGHSVDEEKFDLVYPLEWNLVPPHEIRTPAKYVTGIRSHVSWRDVDFWPFVDLLTTQFQRAHVVSRRLHGLLQPFLPTLAHLSHGVDTAFFTPNPRRYRSVPGRVRVGWAGNRLGPIKAFERCIAPLARLPGVELLSCGFHDRNLGMDDMRRFYDTIDVYICASSAEGNNNSILEAAAMQRAIVTTDTGAVPEFLVHGESALIIEQELPAFIQAVVRLRDDPSLRDRLGVAARESVTRRFDWKDRAEDHAAFFLEALSALDAGSPPARVDRAAAPAGAAASGPEAASRHSSVRIGSASGGAGGIDAPPGEPQPAYTADAPITGHHYSLVTVSFFRKRWHLAARMLDTLFGSELPRDTLHVFLIDRDEGLAALLAEKTRSAGREDVWFVRQSAEITGNPYYLHMNHVLGLLRPVAYDYLTIIDGDFELHRDWYKRTMQLVAATRHLPEVAIYTVFNNSNGTGWRHASYDIRQHDGMTFALKHDCGSGEMTISRQTATTFGEMDPRLQDIGWMRTAHDLGLTVASTIPSYAQHVGAFDSVLDHRADVEVANDFTGSYTVGAELCGTWADDGGRTIVIEPDGLVYSSHGAGREVVGHVHEHGHKQVDVYFADSCTRDIAVDPSFRLTALRLGDALYESRDKAHFLFVYSYEGHYIIKQDGMFAAFQQDVALSHRLGAYRASGITPAATSTSLAAVKRAIDVRRWRLVRTDHCGFNILERAGRYYAVAQSLGSCSMENADIQALLATGDVLVADTQQAVESAARGAAIRHPALVREDYRGFNIIKFGEKFYAVAQSLGPCDLSAADLPALCATGSVLVADTQRAVEIAADGAADRTLVRADGIPER